MKHILLQGRLDEDQAARVVAEMRAADDTLINLRIDSPGGSFAAAIHICLEIEEHPHAVFTTITRALSTAAIIGLAGDARRIDRRGLIMVHCPTRPPPEDAANVCDLVCEYTKRPSQEVMTWMVAERWFTSEDAKQFGFVDSVIDASAPEPVWLPPRTKRAPTASLRPWRQFFERLDLR